MTQRNPQNLGGDMDDDLRNFVELKWCVLNNRIVCTPGTYAYLVSEAQRLDLPASLAQIVRYGEEYGFANDRAEMIP